MNGSEDAHALVSAARDLIRGDDATTAGLWPRAAALLARQGLERAMVRLWEVTAPGLQRTSTRCQLLCVGDMLNDRGLGGRATLTWNSLSSACHHRVYELPPTASELNLALETVWDLAEAVERLRGQIHTV
jgi:hypothetical protein